MRGEHSDSLVHRTVFGGNENQILGARLAGFLHMERIMYPVNNDAVTFQSLCACSLSHDCKGDIGSFIKAPNQIRPNGARPDQSDSADLQIGSLLMAESIAVNCSANI